MHTTFRTAIILGLLVTLGLLSPAAHAAGGTNNLLMNPSFEELEEGWPASWHTSVDDKEMLEICSDTAHTGARSVKFTVPDVGDPDFSVRLEQSLGEIKGGIPYELSAWAKTVGPVEALRLSVRFYDAAGKSLVRFDEYWEHFFDTNGQWQKLGMVVAAPAKAVRAIVYLRAHAPAVVYYDDIHFAIAK